MNVRSKRRKEKLFPSIIGISSLKKKEIIIGNEVFLQTHFKDFGFQIFDFGLKQPICRDTMHRVSTASIRNQKSEIRNQFTLGSSGKSFMIPYTWPWRCRIFPQAKEAGS